MQTQKVDSQGASPSKPSSKSGMSDEQHKGEIEQIIEVFSLGCIMKAVLMEPEGIKAVERSIKIINKMGEEVLEYQAQLESLTQLIQNILITGLGEQKLQQAKLEFKKIQNTRSKQSSLSFNKNHREQMIESMANHLFNAKRDLHPEKEHSLSHVQSFSSKNIVKLTGSQNSQKKQAEINDLLAVVSNLENEGKIQKKLLEDSTRSILEKEEKISNLKVTISKLQEHIIRQVKQQSQTSSRILGDGASMDQKMNHLKFKNSANEPSLIRSEALEREVFQLRKQIETLRSDLSKSVETITQKQGQLLRLSTKFNVSQQKEKEKSDEFLALTKQYSEVRQEVISILNEIKQTKPNRNDLNQSFTSDSADNEQINQLSSLRTDHEILKEKYKRLQASFEESKKQTIKFSSIGPPFMKKSSQMSLPSTKEAQQGDNFLKYGNSKQKNKSRYSTPRPPKKESIKRMNDIESDEKEEILRDIKQISNFQRLSETMKSLTLQNLVNAEELKSKIQGFDYGSSIIHKISSSKFINSFEAKISFILQYVCLLELYFGKRFLSCLREQLMMEDNLSIKPLSTQDLNQTYLIDSQTRNDTSFVSSSNYSKMMSTSKMIINAQYSISEYSNTNNGSSSITKSKQLTGSALSSPNPNSPKTTVLNKEDKVQKLEGQIFELSSIISDSKPNLQQIRNDPQLYSRIQKLKENQVAKMITSLTKENQVFKKCLNQMIKNEQSFTKLNNQIYFDEGGELRRRSTSVVDGNMKKKENENCIVM